MRPVRRSSIANYNKTINFFVLLNEISRSKTDKTTFMSHTIWQVYQVYDTCTIDEQAYKVVDNLIIKFQ